MIQIFNLGYQFANFGGIDINRVQDNYLFLFLRCPTEFWLNDGYQTLPKDTFLLYDKGAPHIYRKIDGHFINDWIHFDITPYDHFFENLGIPFQTPITLPDSQKITDMIFDLYMEYFNTGSQHEIIMDNKANIMFHKLSDMLHATQKNGKKVTAYLMELIEIRKKIQNFEYLPKNSEEIAKKLNISTSYLQHLYKDFFGVSVNQDIILGRIEHAAHLLDVTKYSVSEIAHICGYENLEHFSRQFKKIKGSSPSNYRK